ncbi:ABC transporter substrate-binding protein [Streptomyces sp. WMMC500]|uniref:ABC transporter substrate-binding protein n=1 Tax=Streptomyces sp. WMMC500 TaxID=3015154 RepID=UPI00248B4FA8|nr:ABC transporter substrate-binding protein [Streptomyces sp. WMMC500]WBB62029.1 ABC transporter substrate-binding protein [Streptomyces sp. WMMC500]
MHPPLTGKHHGRRAFLGTGLSLGAALLLPGCRRAVDGQRTSGNGGPSAGGMLHMVQGADIQPALMLSQNNPNFSVNRTVFNTLIALDHHTLRPKAQLATGWTVSDAGRRYVFTLRDDVRYHSGRPFGPDDVVFVLGHMAEETTTTQVKAVAQQVISAEKTGAHEVTVVFGQALDNVWDLFEMMILIDRESVDELTSGREIIGTGPFTLASYRPGATISLRRNEHYWKPSRPYLDGIEIAITSQSWTAVSSLRSLQSQLALDLSPLDAAGIRDLPGFRLVESDANDLTYYIGANLDIAPLDRREVRQAIAWAVDRDRVLDQALGGIGRTSSLPWSPGSPAWDDARADTYGMDAAKARSLLRQAGAAGTEIGLFYSNTLATNAAIAQIVQSNLADVGLRCRLEPKQAADYDQLFIGGKLPGLFVNGHGFGRLSPATLVTGALPFNSEHNASNFRSPEYSRLAHAIWTGRGSALRTAYRELNELFLTEQFVIDLVNSTHTYAISTALKGLAWTMYDYLDLDDAYLA